MSKKNIVIVGAGKGLGNHIAEKFGQNDFRVILVARNQQTLDSYTKYFNDQNIEAYGIAADAANTNSLTTAFEKIDNQFGPINTLVYNACILESGFPTTLSSEVLMQHYQVDVASALHCAQLVLPRMIQQQDGAILFTGGGLAMHPMPEFTCVSIDKAALRALAYAMNQELQDKGIYVGVVSVMGNIAPDTYYAPKIIAEKYWQLYTDRKEYELVY